MTVRPLTGEPAATAPVSPAQRGLWLLDEFHPHSSVYNVFCSVRLTGPLDVAARRHPGGAGRVVAASLPHAADDAREDAVLLTAAGRLWLAGVALDWTAMHRGERRLRVPLPACPFQRTRLRVDLDERDRLVGTWAELADDDRPDYVAMSKQVLHGERLDLLLRDVVLGVDNG